MLDKILEALKQVDDPDLKKDIVTLGMVQDLKLEGNEVSFRLVLTTPACPMKDVIKNACVTAIKYLVDKDLEVNITFDSQVTKSNKVNPENAGFSQVKNIIAVSSGKGGVGKSTVSVNLAVALSQLGARVGLLDADIYGPSIPVMTGTRDLEPVIEQKEKITITPFEVLGIKTMSIGNLIDERQALVWRGPMISTALRQLLNDVLWGELDYLICDMPPGTGDIHLTLAQNFPLNGVVMVTSPQLVSLTDCRKAISMYNTPGVDAPILGIIENMSYFVPNDDLSKKYYLFGQGGGQTLADEYEVHLLGQIPMYESIPLNADEGKVAVLSGNEEIESIFIELAKKVAQSVSIRNGLVGK